MVVLVNLVHLVPSMEAIAYTSHWNISNLNLIFKSILSLMVMVKILKKLASKVNSAVYIEDLSVDVCFCEPYHWRVELIKVGL